LASLDIVLRQKSCSLQSLIYPNLQRHKGLKRKAEHPIVPSHLS
jgi:hypothetical protein